MRNWDSFVMVSTTIIALMLFASGKIAFDNMLDNLQVQQTLIVLLKTLVIIFVATLSMASMVVVLLVDILVSLMMRSEFPITLFLYDTLYVQLARGWYWDMHSGSHIFMSCIMLFGGGLINTYLGPVKRKKKFIYHKNKSYNYTTH